MNLSVAGMIKERARMANPPHDILGIILKARSDQLEGEKVADKDVLSDRVVGETCMQFFLDGHLTVQEAIALVCYFLAMNPEVQERAAQEAQDFHDKHGDNISRSARAAGLTRRRSPRRMPGETRSQPHTSRHCRRARPVA